MCVQLVRGPSLEFVGQMWRAWVAQHSGRVIASSVEAQLLLTGAGPGADKQDGTLPYTQAIIEEATDILLLPLGSYFALTACMLFCQERMSQMDACAAALKGAADTCHAAAFCFT